MNRKCEFLRFVMRHEDWLPFFVKRKIFCFFLRDASAIIRIEALHGLWMMADFSAAKEIKSMLIIEKNEAAKKAAEYILHVFGED